MEKRIYGEYDGPRIPEMYCLKEGHSIEELTNYLFDNKIPHEWDGGDSWRLSSEIKSALEKAGWEFEKSQDRNLGNMPLDERNPESREKALEELKNLRK